MPAITPENFLMVVTVVFSILNGFFAILFIGHNSAKPWNYIFAVGLLTAGMLLLKLCFRAQPVTWLSWSEFGWIVLGTLVLNIALQIARARADKIKDKVFEEEYLPNREDAGLAKFGAAEDVALTWGAYMSFVPILAFFSALIIFSYI